VSCDPAATRQRLIRHVVLRSVHSLIFAMDVNRELLGWAFCNLLPVAAGVDGAPHSPDRQVIGRALTQGIGRPIYSTTKRHSLIHLGTPSRSRGISKVMRKLLDSFRNL
jgi:hypothetical protein